MMAVIMKNHPSWIVILLTAHGVACLYLLLGIFTGFATPVFSVVRHLQ